MNFDFTDDQQAIKRTANELLAARFKPERVRELAEAGSYDDDAWKEMSELGWAGIFIDEEHGGQGLGIVELAILTEELGYALAPVPFLSNAAAGLALQFAGTDEQKQRWLPGIASGEARGTVGMVRDGEARLVPDADTARSEEHTSELQSRQYLVCRLLLEKKKIQQRVCGCLIERHAIPSLPRRLPFRAGELVFFFNDTATTEIYTLSLHDALPISPLADTA